MSDTVPVLWQIEISHFNEKVRWALDYKEIPHERRSVFPGTQEIHARRLVGIRTLPVLRVDGWTIGDSTRIIEVLEELYPDPPLYPADPDERKRALEIEEFFDEHCAHELRRVMFNDIFEDERYVLHVIYGGDPPPGWPVMRAARPLFERVLRARYRIDEETTEQARQAVRAAFDRIEAEVGPSGHLVGDSFSVADLTAAAILSPLVAPPEFPYYQASPEHLPEALRRFRESLEDRPGFQWVLDTYRRYRGASAEVASPPTIVNGSFSNP